MFLYKHTYAALVGWKLGGKVMCSIKPITLPLCPPQIPRELPYERTCASIVRCQCGMAVPLA